MGDILSLWARMLPVNLKPYVEAFLIQNLPYLLPGSEMIYYLDTESRVSEMEETFPLVEQSRIPALKELYRQYDKTLTLLGLPGVLFVHIHAHDGETTVDYNPAKTKLMDILNIFNTRGLEAAL